MDKAIKLPHTPVKQEALADGAGEKAQHNAADTGWAGLIPGILYGPPAYQE